MSPSRTDTRRPRWAFALLLLIVTTGWACGVVRNSGRAADATPATDVFTPARAGVGDAVRAFFGLRPTPQQPLAFSHQLHLSQGAQCTDCHSGVEQGPRAGLPSLSTCMICHSQIATDRPLIQQITALSDKGLDLTWQRVYGYEREAHVRFEHAPHIRAKVECSTCHGDMTTQTVAERKVNLDMAYCVNCHKQKQASNDCLTCHF